MTDLPPADRHALWEAARKADAYISALETTRKATLNALTLIESLTARIEAVENKARATELSVSDLFRKRKEDQERVQKLANWVGSIDDRAERVETGTWSMYDRIENLEATQEVEDCDQAQGLFAAKSKIQSLEAQLKDAHENSGALRRQVESNVEEARSISGEQERTIDRLKGRLREVEAESRDLREELDRANAISTNQSAHLGSIRQIARYKRDLTYKRHLELVRKALGITPDGWVSG